VVLGWLHRRSRAAVRDYGVAKQATIEQLRGLPPTLVLADERDVLRDQREAYAAKLRLAGVPITTVRYDSICHDFMMLNPLSQTNATPGRDRSGNRVLPHDIRQRVTIAPIAKF
jgi:acetyl esterase/lipase